MLNGQKYMKPLMSLKLTINSQIFLLICIIIVFLLSNLSVEIIKTNHG